MSSLDLQSEVFLITLQDEISPVVWNLEEITNGTVEDEDVCVMERSEEMQSLVLDCDLGGHDCIPLNALRRGQP